jgi:hypothetical protein
MSALVVTNSFDSERDMIGNYLVEKQVYPDFMDIDRL